MIDSHKHNGVDSPRINATDIVGPSLITADLATGVSALRTVQPTVIQRGFYTMTNGIKLVTFPQVYSEITTLSVFITSNQNSLNYLQGIVTSAFTVSGSGSDSGQWMSIGYK